MLKVWVQFVFFQPSSDPYNHHRKPNWIFPLKETIIWKFAYHVANFIVLVGSSVKNSFGAVISWVKLV